MWPVFDLTPLIVLEAARGARDHDLPYYDAQVGKYRKSGVWVGFARPNTAFPDNLPLPSAG